MGLCGFLLSIKSASCLPKWQGCQVLREKHGCGQQILIFTHLNLCAAYILKIPLLRQYLKWVSVRGCFRPLCVGNIWLGRMHFRRGSTGAQGLGQDTVVTSLFEATWCSSSFLCTSMAPASLDWRLLHEMLPHPSPHSLEHLHCTIDFSDGVYIKTEKKNFFYFSNFLFGQNFFCLDLGNNRISFLFTVTCISSQLCVNEEIGLFSQ